MNFSLLLTRKQDLYILEGSMIEINLAQSQGDWHVNAAILPYGGLGVAKVAQLAKISCASFSEAEQAVSNLSSASFAPDQNRWPVSDPKFQIINDSTHEDSKNFANYRIQRGDVIIGRIDNFPRGSAIELIKLALEIVAQSEKI